MDFIIIITIISNNILVLNECIYRLLPVFLLAEEDECVTR